MRVPQSGVSCHPWTGFSFAFAIPDVLSLDLKKTRLSGRLTQARPGAGSSTSIIRLELFQTRRAMKLDRRLTELVLFCKTGISEHLSNL
jgi:hypothetical protein